MFFHILDENGCDFLAYFSNMSGNLETEKENTWELSGLAVYRCSPQIQTKSPTILFEPIDKSRKCGLNFHLRI